MFNVNSFNQKIKHYLPRLYLRGVVTHFPCVNVSNNYCRMSDLTLGNVFWPRPQTYDSTISRLLARFENLFEIPYFLIESYFKDLWKSLVEDTPSPLYHFLFAENQKVTEPALL